MATVEPERTVQIFDGNAEHRERPIRLNSRSDKLEARVDWERRRRCAGLRKARLRDGVILGCTVVIGGAFSFGPTELQSAYKKKSIESPVCTPVIKIGTNVRVSFAPTMTLKVVACTRVTSKKAGRKNVRTVMRVILLRRAAVKGMFKTDSRVSIAHGMKQTTHPSISSPFEPPNFMNSQASGST